MTTIEMFEQLVEEMVTNMEMFVANKHKKRVRQNKTQKISHVINKINSKISSIDLNKNERLTEITNLKDIKVAAILDEFSYNCFKDDLNLIALDKNNYMKQLKSIKPHILFVESAWNSYNGGFRISTDLEKVIKMIYYCRKHNIITIFWNKEDPVHFDDFIKKAVYFDYIFTTDENSVENYKKYTNKDNVFSLMFAVNPKIHNPIKEFDERIQKGVFAGTFYRNQYPNRLRDSMYMFYALKDYGLAIYDRNYERNIPAYRFPNLFKENVLGSLPYDEINKSYKGYLLNLNLNTVTDSDTMFSRRIFEVLACNTPIVSNYSKGIEKHFKDIVLMGKTYEDYKEIYEKVFNNQDYVRHISHLGVREVLSKHTYRNRVEELFSKIGVKYNKKELSVLVIGNCNKKDEAKIKKMFDKQKYSNKTLVFSDNLSLYDIKQYDYIAVFDSNNYYGEYYLNDLLLATKYLNNIDVIGKNQKYEYNNELVLNNLEEYVYTKNLSPSSSIINTNFITKENFENILNDKLKIKKEQGFAIDSFSFCQNGFNISKEEMKKVNNESW